jgi:hypothetical protein
MVNCRVGLARRTRPHEIKPIQREWEPERIGLDECIATISRLWTDIDPGDVESGALETFGRTASAAEEV